MKDQQKTKIPTSWKRGDAIRDWARSRCMTPREKLEAVAAEITEKPFGKRLSAALDIVTVALDELDL